jgi:thiol:disulfide interchange protein DsbD
MNDFFCKMLLAAVATVFLAQNVFAAEPVKATPYWPADRARPGDTLALAVAVQIQEGFHINADARQIKPAADFFTPYPSQLSVINADEGLIAESPLYPAAKQFKAQYAKHGLMSFSGQIVIYVPVKFADSLAPGARPSLRLDFAYQACTENHCLLPQTIRLEPSIEIGDPAAVPKSANQELFAGYNPQRLVASSHDQIDFRVFGWKFAVNGSSWAGMLLLLSIAAFGGMLLNFTPCVLPLIPIKIISLSYAAKDRRHCLLLGAAMSLGVLAFWLFLGGLIALVSGFSATNQLFQYPAFTIAVGMVIGVMALGMFDFFSLPLPQWLYLIHPEQDSLHGSFGLGILAAVLSTPCTAPFMGAAAAWAATRPPAATLAVFAAIGSGMALPYLLLSAAPHLVEKMPRSGPASVLVKQVMGLLMLAAAVYFIGIGVETLLASPADPPGRQHWWLVTACSATAGGWLFWRTFRIASGGPLKIFFMGIGVLLIVISGYGAVNLTDRGPINWVYYSPERFEQTRAQGKTVVMIFTAEWCLNCKALEQGVLDSQKIVRLLNRDEVVPMKVDITGSNPPGREMLRQAGSLSIPLLVVFAPDGRRVYKSDFYTAEELKGVLLRTLEES